MVTGLSQTPNYNRIFFFFGLALAANLLKEISWKLFSYLEKQIYLSQNKISSLFLDKTINLDLPTREDSTFHTLYNKVSEAYAYKPRDYFSHTYWLLSGLIQLSASLLILLKFNWIYALLVLLSLIPTLLVNLKFEKNVWGIWAAKADIKNKYWDTQYYLSSLSSFKEVKLFRLEKKLLSTLNDLYSSFKDQELVHATRNTKFTILTKFFEFILFCSAEINLILQTLAKVYSISQYSFINSSLYSFSTSLTNIFSNLQSLYANDLYMADFFTYLDTKNQIIWPKRGIILNPASPPTIQFKNVSFRYPGNRHYIFKDLNLTIPSGQDIALVGENGAGKTTLIKLICRFYDPTDGQILINGQDLKLLNRDSWYTQLGILFQDFNRYAYSVAENIQLGKNQKKISESELKTYTQQAGAYQFIQKYPKKYNQPLSKSYDGGIEPSGGQWQRLALARAFYRNANILILDEPTSAIDAKGEYEIFQKIDRVQKKKTTIIISHRFSTVRKADHIYVLQRGRIVESGNHQELMKNQGLYHQMFTLQAKGYEN